MKKRNYALQTISCQSPIWIISASFEFMSVLIFYAFVRKIDDTTMEQIADLRKDGYTEEKLIERHSILYSKLRDLWIIIRFYLVISFYQMAFALISFGWTMHIRDCTDPNHKYHKYLQCNVITNIPAIDTWFWFISRCFSYVVWLYPVIYIFWQAKEKNDKEA